MPILLFICLFFLSIFRSGYIYASIMEFIRLINLGLIFYIVVNFLDNEKDIKRLLSVILFAGTGIALFGILQYLGVVAKPWWDNIRFLSIFFFYSMCRLFAFYVQGRVVFFIGIDGVYEFYDIQEGEGRDHPFYIYTLYCDPRYFYLQCY